MTALRLAAALLAALGAVACPHPARAQDDPSAEADEVPRVLPVDVACEVDTSESAVTGLFRIKLAYSVAADIRRPWAPLVEVWQGKETLLSWMPAVDPPMLRWTKGMRVPLELTAPLPADRDPAETLPLEVRVAFVEPKSGAIVPPQDGVSFRQARSLAAEFTPPDVPEVRSEERVAEIVKVAQGFAAAGRKPDAWAALEAGLRASSDDRTKARFRDAIAALGDFPPRPLSAVESKIVADRIEDERQRYLRIAAGRLRDRGKLHASLRILESIGGKLDADVDKAVLGALNAAARTQKSLLDLKEEIWGRITPAEKAAAEKEAKELGKTKACLERARELAKAGRFAEANALYASLAWEAPKDVRAAASDDVKEMRKLWLATMPPGEQELCDAELHHPSFARTSAALSHHFVFIGPKQLVETIPAQSRLWFDLAYVHLTDLFGRRPNPEGDRVTVYFKELFDFAGGIGGGKTIDIGNAKHDATGTRVDNGLLFHELTHCIDDTKPVYSGHREGLADFGAAYAHEALGRGPEARASIASSLAAFRADYLLRDLEYWRIPNYGPSAGFFLHFSETFAKQPDGRHDWAPWRKFFRSYRRAAIRDGRESYVARGMAHFLVQSFGPAAFDELVKFRWPLSETDRASLAREFGVYEEGDGAIADSESVEKHAPTSPLRRDLIARRAIEAFRIQDHDEARRICAQELGILYEWRVIGPFEGKDADPLVQVFPPEVETDFAKEYPQRQNIARWKAVGEPGPVQIDSLGWVTIKYAYMEDTATYAHCHVNVDKDQDALVHLRADDDFALFLNGERVESFVNRGWNDSTPLWWRGPVGTAPDAMRLPVKLRAGKNRILLKVKNRSGPAGFVVALSRPDGGLVPGLFPDIDPPPPREGKAPAEPKWQTVAKHEFKGKSGAQKLDVPVGGFDTANKALAGTSTAKGVAWRKYTVRPGFPKDSPSNAAWLKAKETEGLEDFRLTMTLVPPKGDAPKLAVTFQGEGGGDGLSGWNILLWNAGGKAGGQVERYEDLQYQWGAAEFPAREEMELVVEVVARRLSLRINGATLLEKAPIKPIPGKSRIGFFTWGADPKIASLLLETPKK
ncbi:MAG: hypothetical protein HMLKMBBP_01426 [Planctomycetes bacterium]|nr:hypothetical protein [Planctomycetota bacterium]